MIECDRDRGELVALARREIERAARGEVAQLYTEEILVDAAELLADVYAAGIQRGIEPDRWDFDPRSDRLPYAVLQARRLDIRQNPNMPTTVEACRPALTQFVDHFRHSMALYDPELGAVVLPRTETTPPWGHDGQARLTVSIAVEGANTRWVFTLDRSPKPVVDVAAEFGAELAELAELATQVNHGHLGNPFQR